MQMRWMKRKKRIGSIGGERGRELTVFGHTECWGKGWQVSSWCGVVLTRERIGPSPSGIHGQLKPLQTQKHILTPILPSKSYPNAVFWHVLTSRTLSLIVPSPSWSKAWNAPAERQKNILKTLKVSYFRGSRPTTLTPKENVTKQSRWCSSLFKPPPQFKSATL